MYLMILPMLQMNCICRALTQHNATTQGFAVGSDGTNAGYAFIGVWVALLAIFLGVVGTLILRKHRTPEHHGQLVGMSFMMAHIMLISGVAAGTGRECNVEGTSAAEKAVGAFSIVLFFLYLFFSMLLMKWKQDLLDIMDLDDEEDTGIEMNGDDDDLDSASLGLNGNGESASARPGNASEEGGDLKMV